jgi:hypothetical protein
MVNLVTPAQSSAPIAASGIAGKISLGAAGAAVLSKLSCCVLPFTLMALGTGSSAGSMVRALVPFQTPLLIAGGLATAGAWGFYLRDRKITCEPSCANSRKSGRSLPILIASTILFAIAASWTLYEPYIQDWLFGLS